MRRGALPKNRWELHLEISFAPAFESLLILIFPRTRAASRVAGSGLSLEVLVSISSFWTLMFGG